MFLSSLGLKQPIKRIDLKQPKLLGSYFSACIEMDEGMDLKQTTRSLLTYELIGRLNSKQLIGSFVSYGAKESLCLLLLFILFNKGRKTKTYGCIDESVSHW